MDGPFDQQDEATDAPAGGWAAHALGGGFMGLLQEAPLLPPADQPEEAPDGDETSYAHTSGILELSPGIPFPLLPLPLDAAVGGPPPHGEGLLYDSDDGGTL